MKANNWNEMGLYTCPICTEFTANDEWAKPQVACINCGVQE